MALYELSNSINARRKMAWTQRHRESFKQGNAYLGLDSIDLGQFICVKKMTDITDMYFQIKTKLWTLYCTRLLDNLRESFGLPNPNMEPFKAIKAASPPLDPPGVREGSLGWQVVP